MDYTRWVDRDYNILEIKNMEDSHILNCIKMLKNGSQKNGAKLDFKWLKLHRDNYIKEFEGELKIREELNESRRSMMCPIQ